MAKKRTDAERRVRQVERFSRLLRVLHCISSSGHWDAEALAKELECSRRTVHRLLQTLSMAGVPWFFDESLKAYKVRPGFRFNLFAQRSELVDAGRREEPKTLQQAHQALEKAEALAAQLRELCDGLTV